jgi:hypothetical protein
MNNIYAMKQLTALILISCLSGVKLFAYQTIRDVATKAGVYDIPITVCLPEKTTGKMPVMFFVHGGGWNGGDDHSVPAARIPADCEFLCDQMGIIYVGLAYRCKGNNGTFHLALQDLESSIEWFEERAAYGLIRSEQKLEASPYHNLRKKPAATLLLHRKDDWLCHYSQSVKYAEQLKKAGGKSKLVLYEGINRFMDNNRYQLDRSFSNARWKNIFGNIEPFEHIYTIWYDKSFYQQNRFQEIFDTRPPHKYILKPTRKVVMLWESIFGNCLFDRYDARPWDARTTFAGYPGDFYRGYGVSYIYMKGGMEVYPNNMRKVLDLKL